MKVATLPVTSLSPVVPCVFCVHRIRRALGPSTVTCFWEHTHFILVYVRDRRTVQGTRDTCRPPSVVPHQPAAPQSPPQLRASEQALWRALALAPWLLTDGGGGGGDVQGLALPWHRGQQALGQPALGPGQTVACNGDSGTRQILSKVVTFFPQTKLSQRESVGLRTVLQPRQSCLRGHGSLCLEPTALQCVRRTLGPGSDPCVQQTPPPDRLWIQCGTG